MECPLQSTFTRISDKLGFHGIALAVSNILVVVSLITKVRSANGLPLAEYAALFFFYHILFMIPPKKTIKMLELIDYTPVDFR